MEEAGKRDCKQHEAMPRENMQRKFGEETKTTIEEYQENLNSYLEERKKFEEETVSFRESKDCLSRERNALNKLKDFFRTEKENLEKERMIFKQERKLLDVLMEIFLKEQQQLQEEDYQKNLNPNLEELKKYEEYKSKIEEYQENLNSYLEDRKKFEEETVSFRESKDCLSRERNTFNKLKDFFRREKEKLEKERVIFKQERKLFDELTEIFLKKQQQLHEEKEEILAEEKLLSFKKRRMPSRKSRLRWYGHVMRRDEQHIRRTLREMEVQGTRRRGRPKRRWVDCIQDDLRSKGLTGDKMLHFHQYPCNKIMLTSLHQLEDTISQEKEEEKNESDRVLQAWYYAKNNLCSSKVFVTQGIIERIKGPQKSSEQV
ncbi:trichohyalin-like [Palaemon carinicauda]|uniref:trichohyalin-like n=1 Tax=Palaemon carinicauda TaxID=392227 RepID=UPI0035B5D118